MKLRHSLAAGLMAVLAFSLPAAASGIFQYDAATQANVDGTGCVPMDVYGPNYGNSQGLNPQTVCAQPGQLGYQSNHNALGRYSNIPIGSVAYGSLGTNTTPVAGTVYVSSFQLPVDMVDATGIACMNGGTAATDKLLYSIYDADGVLVANTAVAGTVATGTDSFQALAFTAVADLNAGSYFLGWQTNGTTTRFRTVATATYIGIASGSATGTFGTLPAITAPTTFTADKAPICYVYQ